MHKNLSKKQSYLVIISILVFTSSIWLINFSLKNKPKSPTQSSSVPVESESHFQLLGKIEKIKDDFLFINGGENYLNPKAKIYTVKVDPNTPFDQLKAKATEGKRSDLLVGDQIRFKLLQERPFDGIVEVYIFR